MNNPSLLPHANLVFLCSPNSTKQNLLEELDGIQSDLTALKLKNEELKVNQQDYSQEVCSIYMCYLLGKMLREKMVPDVLSMTRA